MPRQPGDAVDLVLIGFQHDLAPQRRLFDQRSGSEKAREIEQFDRLGRIAAGLDHRLGEGHRAGEPQWKPTRVDVRQALLGLGLVAEDIRKGPPHLRDFAGRNGAALDQADDVARLAAAQQIDDDRVGLALRLPDLGLGRGDRGADGADPFGLAGVGRFVAGGDARLQVLQVQGQVGDRLRRSGRAAERSGDRRRRQRVGEASPSHGLTPLSRISMRRFSAANGWAGSRSRLSA